MDEVVQYNVSVTVFVRYDPTTSSRRNLQGSRDPLRRNLQDREDGGKHSVFNATLIFSVRVLYSNEHVYCHSSTENNSQPRSSSRFE